MVIPLHSPALDRALNFQEIYRQFLAGIKSTSWLECVAVVSGIASVWLSMVENILVYPTGLASTIIYIYISLRGHLFGEASVNFYYTVMSVIGWIWWARKNEQKQHVLRISYSTPREWLVQLGFFAGSYLLLYTALHYLKIHFPGAIPWGDAFASSTAYTGMWLMARKKVESWYWWIATNTASIPLYFVKGYVFTSFYYLVLLIMAFGGLVAWMKKAKPFLQA
jgi:nicotinamide mononucleotide transporter